MSEEPKFKVGDRVRHVVSGDRGVVVMFFCKDNTCAMMVSYGPGKCNHEFDAAWELDVPAPQALPDWPPAMASLESYSPARQDEVTSNQLAHIVCLIDLLSPAEVRQLANHIANDPLLRVEFPTNAKPT